MATFLARYHLAEKAAVDEVKDKRVFDKHVREMEAALDASLAERPLWYNGWRRILGTVHVPIADMTCGVKRRLVQEE